ncbi:MAG: acyltransferase family protein [Acidobacteriota bacterium]
MKDAASLAIAKEREPQAGLPVSKQPIRLDERGRLGSLDVFRGVTMFLLVADITGLYRILLQTDLKQTFLGPVLTQLTHHPWNGLHFWDLVQPFFMFIVGVAMPFSIGKRLERGDSYGAVFAHVVKRSVILLALGLTVYIVEAGRLVFELWNVLAQLSFTYFVAFLMMRKRARTQIVFTAGLLVLTELAYRLWWIPGFDQPFVPDRNFGSWVDLLLMGKLSAGHWVAVNAVPTTAHTMWGVLAGQFLLSSRPIGRKLAILALTGAGGVILGYSLNPITPIIKRICTSSFVIVSGGWCLLMLAFLFWLVDVKGDRRWAKLFVLFGLNPIFIYLFSLLNGTRWLKTIVHPFTAAVFSPEGQAVPLATACVVLLIECYLLYWLYRRKIFIRI